MTQIFNSPCMSITVKMNTFKDKLENTFKVPRTLLSIVGCFPKSGKFSTFSIKLVLLFLIYSTMTTFCSMYYDWPDLPKVAMNASPFLASLACTIKFANYVAHRNEIGILIKTIREDFWGTYELAPEEEKEIVESYGQTVLKYNTFQAASMFSAGPLWVVKPLLEMYVLTPEDPTESVGRILPFKNWVPFHLDMYADPLYQILFVVQGLGSFFTISMLASMDCLFVFLVLNTCAQFKVVQTRVKNFDKNQENNSDAQEKFLYGSIKLHQKLCQFCVDLEISLTMTLLCQFVICCLFLCICGFIITVIPGNAYIFLQNIICLTAALGQLFLHCFTADKLTTEAVAVAYAAYSSNWYDASLSIKKLIMFIIMRSQKPIYLTAGKFTPASVESFELVTRTAVSYFTVLSSVMEDK